SSAPHLPKTNRSASTVWPAHASLQKELAATSVMTLRSGFSPWNFTTPEMLPARAAQLSTKQSESSSHGRPLEENLAVGCFSAIAMGSFVIGFEGVSPKEQF